MSRSSPTTGATGPYVQKGRDYRNLDNEERLFTVTLDEALRDLRPAQGVPPRRPEHGGQGSAARSSAPTPCRERPVVAKDGKFGVYVTDGETNASIGKGDRIEEMLPERAFELLAIRRETVAAKGGAPAKRTARAKGAGQEGRGEEAAPAKRSAAKKP